MSELTNINIQCDKCEESGLVNDEIIICSEGIFCEVCYRKVFGPSIDEVYDMERDKMDEKVANNG